MSLKKVFEKKTKNLFEKSFDPKETNLTVIHKDGSKRKLRVDELPRYVEEDEEEYDEE